MSCISPFFRQHNGEWLPVSCGRCPDCKRRRTDGWVFRLLQEEKVSSSAYFVTLTYSPEFLPISPNGFPTLDKDEFPRFMKRLRKLTSNVLKYYACGEYGSKNSRPHYHAVVFNVPDDSLFFDAWSICGRNFGTVHVGQVSGDSIAYTMKYIDKSQYKSRHSRDDRVPEFALMSKGLGKNYLTSAIVDYHKQDLSRLYLTKDGGGKIALPRYYRDRVYDEDERAEQLNIIQMAVGASHSDNYAEFVRLYGHIPGYTYDRYCESQRLGAVNKFYSNQPDRSL